VLTTVYSCRNVRSRIRSSFTFSSSMRLGTSAFVGVCRCRSSSLTTAKRQSSLLVRTRHPQCWLRHNGKPEREPRIRSIGESNDARLRRSTRPFHSPALVQCSSVRVLRASSGSTRFGRIICQLPMNLKFKHPHYRRMKLPHFYYAQHRIVHIFHRLAGRACVVATESFRVTRSAL
jgi:hypothetical protein